MPSAPATPRPFRIGLARYEAGTEEVTAIRQVIESGVLTNGPRTREFEQVFARRHEARHAVAVANGTIGLTGIYLAHEIGEGDEVIVPSLTFVSTATSVVHVGAVPVFADVDDRTFTLDVHDVRRCLSRRTRAIVVVHYGGQAGNLKELRELADDARVPLIEDAAQAHGAMYQGHAVGAQSSAGMFSFTPTKNITTGEGGVITTNNAALADRLRLLRNHGQTAPYEHAMLGFNWRMTEMQAAMGLVQLTRLDGILARKRANALWMSDRLEGLPGITLPHVMPDRDHPYMLYTILVDRDRDNVMDRLRGAGIEARLYFPPAHLQPMFARQTTALPVTEHLAQTMISLPFHSMLTGTELEYVARTLEQAISSPTR
jgi:perosamine synthetase